VVTGPGHLSIEKVRTEKPFENRGRTTDVSDNYRSYAAKMAELRVYRSHNRSLESQLHELLLFVLRCEALWDSAI